MAMNDILAQIRVLSQPRGEVRLGEYLTQHLNSPEWSEFRAAVAFVKRSGIRHLREPLRRFSNCAFVKMSVGVDCAGTSYEGLADLLNCLEGNGDIFVYHNEHPSIFHPKVYLFRNNRTADIAAGSGNLTEGGLFTNCEIFLAVRLDLTHERNQQLTAEVEALIDHWCDEDAGTAKRLTRNLLEQLLCARYILRERETGYGDADGMQPTGGPGPGQVGPESLIFARSPVPPPPPLAPAEPRQQHGEEVVTHVAETPEDQHLVGFLMTLHPTDVGTGQTSPGTSRRSPEVFIPLSARDYAPEFWGWPRLFSEDSRRAGKYDRTAVPVRLGASIIRVNMMTWPVKHDFRIRNEQLRSAGNVGDLLRIERTPSAAMFDYYVEIVPKETTQHNAYLRLCTHAVRNSDKRWGYY